MYWFRVMRVLFCVFWSITVKGYDRTGDTTMVDAQTLLANC